MLANMMAFVFLGIAGSQNLPAAHSSNVVILRGQVSNEAHQPVADAIVHSQQEDSSDMEETRTNANGDFALTISHPGNYTVFAEKSGARSQTVTWTSYSTEKAAPLKLIVVMQGSKDTKSTASPTAATDLMEFADKPNFTVAGVTDWTAVGGHGTDASVHASEVLTRHALSLKPSDATDKSASALADRDISETELRLRTAESENPDSVETHRSLGEFYLHAGRASDALRPLQIAYGMGPSREGVEYSLALALKEAGNLSEANQHVSHLLRSNSTADVHRLAAEINEKLGDSLAAVHEFEIAAKLDPSEQNYFEWGSELLLHRALSEAEQVLSKGAEAYPQSSRMLAALGTAFLGGALYEQAARRLCDASDLDPTAAEPYMFLGNLEIVSPTPLACIQPRLSRFVEQQPDSALANYYYAMALSKNQEQRPDPQIQQQVEALLEKAIMLDSQCGDAYLQLGILNSSQHHLEKAVKYYASAIRVNPKLSEAHYRLGLAYDRLHQPEKAKAEFALHDEIEKQQADAIEQQRRELKQFQVVPSEQPKKQPLH